MKNYENLGSRKGPDSVEEFYQNKLTEQAWMRVYSLWANSPGEEWMPLEGNCEALFQKWQNKENMQEYATMNYLEKWAGEPSFTQKNFFFKGCEVIEKTVKPFSTSAHVGVPVSWIGSRVAVVRLD